MKTLTLRATLAGWLVALISTNANAQVALEMHWDTGAEQCEASTQRIQVHAIDASTIAIRQNPCVDYEANLMYLLIGEQRALLIDSGATDDPKLTGELTELVSQYLEPDGERLPLVVAHTHGHQDHRAGDAAFAALPATEVVPHDGEGMRRYFGLEQWPQGGARFDLGNRIVELVPTPGHHEDHVAFVDQRTRLVFSGDFLLPGRIVMRFLLFSTPSSIACRRATATDQVYPHRDADVMRKKVLYERASLPAAGNAGETAPG